MKSYLRDSLREKRGCTVHSAHRPTREKETVFEEEPSPERAAVRIIPDYTIDQRDLT